MAAGTAVTDFSQLMKTRYTKKPVEDMTFRKNPAFATMAKFEDFTGDSMKIPSIYGNPQGQGSNFAEAQANNTPGGNAAYLLTRAKQYGIFQIQSELIRASRGDPGAFMEAQVRLLDGTWKQTSREFEIFTFRDGTGVRGQIASTATVSSSAALALGRGVGSAVSGPDTIAVSEYDDRNFEVDMAICLAFYSGGVWAYRNPGGNSAAKVYIIAVDRTNHTITVSNTLKGAAVAINSIITAAVAGDFIVRAGDLVGQSSGGVITGFGGWNPIKAPAAGVLFFTQDRSFDSNRMSGVKQSLLNSPIEDAILSTCALIDEQDGVPDICWMNANNMNQLVTALGARKTYSYVESHKRADIGFRSVTIQTPTGDVECVSASGCPDQFIYVQESGDWVFNSLGGAPSNLDDDELKFVRLPNADAYETRIGAYCNISCHDTAHQGVCQVRT